ncbi:hypothetical protein DPMN_094407 [Dreissena polymorpha]|uniref:DNA polymerase eta n=1 Tax=Dreissena polymorpha TaxID=45954 RepID=A0A9D4L5P3_DREPO|nr:hypothetical protein DPMN_094407 [Dreissena polymorpha]
MMMQSSQKFIENCSGSHSKKSKPSILSFFKSKETEAQNMPKLGNERDFKPNIFVNEGNQTQVVDCSSESESDNGFTQSNSSEGYIRSDSKHKLHLPDDPVSVKFDLENLGKTKTSSSKTDVSSFFIRTITPLTANTDCSPKNVHKRGLETESFESKDMKKQSELNSSSAEITSFFKRKLLGLPHAVLSKTVTSKNVHDKLGYKSNMPSVQDDCNRGCFVQENKTDCVEAEEGNGLDRDVGKLELNSYSQSAVISKEEINSESETVLIHSEDSNSVYENHVIPNTAVDSGTETAMMSKQALNCDRLNVIPVKEFQSGSENVVISLEDYLECEKCHKMMTVWEMPEHMDFHFALQLQEDMNVPLTDGKTLSDWLETTFNEATLEMHDRRLAVGAVIAEEMRQAVYEDTGFRCSAGIAHNKMLAKLACGFHKPNKQTILPHSQVPQLFKSLLTEMMFCLLKNT